MKIRKLNSALIGLFLISLTIGGSLKDVQTENEATYKSSELNILSSGSWDLTGNPISIDDSVPAINWANTAATYDWCSGSGTISDPYVIENVTINGNDSGYGIEIQHSSVYFIIRNCTVYNSGYDTACIYLNNVNFGSIVNNSVWDSGDHGIFFQGGGS